MDIYPLAKLIPADPTNYKVGRSQDVRLVVIHITSGRAKALPVAQMWQTPNHKSSAHFVIDQDGSVIQAIRTSHTAWHAHNANACGVGIEHCSREPNEPAFPKEDPGLPVSEAQYQSSAKLTAWLLKNYNLAPTRDYVKGHCEVDTITDHTGCPNSIWDWDHYMELVTNEYNQLVSCV